MEIGYDCEQSIQRNRDETKSEVAANSRGYIYKRCTNSDSKVCEIDPSFTGEQHSLLRVTVKKLSVKDYIRDRCIIL